MLAERIGGYEEDRGGRDPVRRLPRPRRPGQPDPGHPPAAGGAWLAAAGLGRGLRPAQHLLVGRRRAATRATLANNQYATPAYRRRLQRRAAPRRRPAYSWEVGADLRDFNGSSQRASCTTRDTPTGTRVAGGGELVAGVYAEGEPQLRPLAAHRRGAARRLGRTTPPAWCRPARRRPC